jgi:hypothetical protein
VIIDAALETLAPEARRTFIANFQKELPDSALSRSVTFLRQATFSGVS